MRAGLALAFYAPMTLDDCVWAGFRVWLNRPTQLGDHLRDYGVYRSDGKLTVEEALKLPFKTEFSITSGETRVGANRKYGIVNVNRRNAVLDVGTMRAPMAETPFWLASTASVSPGAYTQNGFGMGMQGHGWMAAFKGEGHKYVASRRWLERGPWRVVRADNDVTIVQFHDLDADEATAREQCLLGHPLLANCPHTGFTSPRYKWPHDPLSQRILYDAKERLAITLVSKRAVSIDEMRDAAAAKVLQPFGNDKPIDDWVFEFVEPDQGRKQLHDLWMRGLRCVIYDERGRKVRLDDTYEPPPHVVPEWVKRVQDREGF